MAATQGNDQIILVPHRCIAPSPSWTWSELSSAAPEPLPEPPAPPALLPLSPPLGRPAPPMPGAVWRATRRQPLLRRGALSCGGVADGWSLPRRGGASAGKGGGSKGQRAAVEGRGVSRVGCKAAAARQQRLDCGNVHALNRLKLTSSPAASSGRLLAPPRGAACALSGSRPAPPRARAPRARL